MFLIFFFNCKNVFNTINNMTICQEIAMTRARIGHTFLTRLRLVSKDPEPMCNKCPVFLTTERIVQLCPERQNPRNTLSIPDNLEEALNRWFSSEVTFYPRVTWIECKGDTKTSGKNMKNFRTKSYCCSCGSYYFPYNIF